MQLSPFSPHHSPLPHPFPPPALDPTPLWLCPCSWTCSLTTLPLFPLLFPPPSALVTASLFFISMSLVLFCLLVWLVD